MQVEEKMHVLILQYSNRTTLSNQSAKTGKCYANKVGYFSVQNMI